jgi:hypothetical protein
LIAELRAKSGKQSNGMQAVSEADLANPFLGTTRRQALDFPERRLIDPLTGAYNRETAWAFSGGISAHVSTYPSGGLDFPCQS